jgi:hypothetical protein
MSSEVDVLRREVLYRSRGFPWRTTSATCFCNLQPMLSGSSPCPPQQFDSSFFLSRSRVLWSFRSPRSDVCFFMRRDLLKQSLDSVVQSTHSNEKSKGSRLSPLPQSCQFLLIAEMGLCRFIRYREILICKNLAVLCRGRWSASPSSPNPNPNPNPNQTT